MDECISVHQYSISRLQLATNNTLVSGFENKILRAEACAVKARTLKDQGFIPDVILAHVGWGEQLFLRDVWPDTTILSFIEYYYHTTGSDVLFDPEFAEDSLETRMHIRVKNAALLLALDSSDAGITPTSFQHSLLPELYKPMVRVIHDGIDTSRIGPNSEARISLGRGGEVRVGDEVITFVNRNLEPYRGYHSFIRALPNIQKERPHARVVIVGGEGVGYGRPPSVGTSYKNIYLSEVSDRLDMSRIHFVGNVDYTTFISLMQLSAVHVYLTYPFVLSWSLLEAMACGALVVGSNTLPVREVIEDGYNGRLTDFFDVSDICNTVVEVLERRNELQCMRDSARDTIVQRYDFKKVCLPQHLSLINEIAVG